LRILRC